VTAPEVARGVGHLLDQTLGRAVRALLTVLIVGYQRLLSPLLGPRCRFYPSCSAYAVRAIQVHGAGKGTVLAVARIGRCHPWHPGGVDPVPPRGAWKSDPYVALESHDDVIAALSAADAGAPHDHRDGVAHRHDHPGDRRTA
jgi:putative membrane protein insertion efficiency factor